MFTRTQKQNRPLCLPEPRRLIGSLRADVSMHDTLKGGLLEAAFRDGKVQLDMHKQIKVLTVEDEHSGCLRAHRVPQKCIMDRAWVTKQVCIDVTLWGHSTAQ